MREGAAAWAKGDWQSADANYTLAWADAQQFASNSTRRIDTLTDLAQVRLTLQRYADAERFLQQRLEVGETKGWTNTFEYMIALVSLGDAMAYQKKYSDAEESYERAESVMRYRSRFTGGFYGALLARRANLYAMQGRLAPANVYYQASLRQLELLASPQSGPVLRASAVVQLGSVLNDYSVLKMQEKKFRDAEELLQKSIKFISSQFGGTSANLVTPFNNLALALAAQEKFSEAEVAVDRSLFILKKNGVTGHPILDQTRLILLNVQQHKIPN